MQDFKKLSVWEKSHLLAMALYKVTAAFPKEEIFGLTSQMRRSCISIPANIAEGCGRDGVAELAHFMQIAQGSASELEYHLLLAHDLNYLNKKEYQDLNKQLNEVRRMLTTFIQRLKNSN